MTLEKLDLKKARKELFTAPLNRFVPVEVPRVSYLMVDGHGDPNKTPSYKQAVESLYSTPTPSSSRARLKAGTSSLRRLRGSGRLRTRRVSRRGGRKNGTGP